MGSVLKQPPRIIDGFFRCFVRMNANCAPDILVLFGNGTHAWKAVEPGSDREHGTDAGLARTRFLCADWVRGGGGLAPAPATFDVVLCFNVTKWVHLNGGDDALRALLFKAHEALRPGGHLLLVAQAWGSYARSRHLCHAFAAALPRLRLRPAHFLDFALDEVGFRLHSAVAVPRPSSPGTAQLLVLRKAA
jgi:SAM-dependent methyltransferase